MKAGVDNNGNLAKREAERDWGVWCAHGEWSGWLAGRFVLGLWRGSQSEALRMASEKNARAKENADENPDGVEPTVYEARKMGGAP